MNIDSYLQLKPNPKIPAFRSGDTVRVHAKVIEGDRERIQAFEGVVLRIRRGGANSNFTVRRISHGIGVERIFPYYSPLVDKVDVIRVGRVRRARLYYLRERIGKAARIKPGSRARFEALTAPGAVPIAEDIEEEIIAADEDLAGDEPVVEGETVTAEAAEEPETEAPADEAEAAEVAPEPEAYAVEPEELPAEAESAGEPAADGSAGAPAEEPADAAEEPVEEAPAEDNAEQKPE